MQETIIKTPFKYEFFIDGRKAVWSFSYRKIIPPYILYTVSAAVVLMLGLSTEKGGRFPLATIFGGGFLFYMLLTWVGLLEMRIKFFKRAKNAAARFEQLEMDATYTLTDDSLIYADKEKVYDLKWSLFKSVLVFKDNIFIVAKDTGSVIFTIGRMELGDPAFLELYDTLKEKIGK